MLSYDANALSFSCIKPCPFALRISLNFLHLNYHIEHFDYYGIAMSQILILLKLMKDRINFILHFIRRKLIYPFKEDILFFLLLWVIISFPNCYSQKGSYTYVIYLSLMYYILTYLICFLLNINLRIAKALKPILFIFTIILSLLNFYCLITFGCLLSNDLVQIIAGTNTNEAKEFFNTYISWRDIVLFLLTIIICCFIGFYLPHK